MSEAFVYCWTDHKTNKLYIGSHKGSINDGYVCSSKYMMKEYNERPNDFTRQIIAQGFVEDIRTLETKILKSVNARLNEDFYNKHQNDGLYFNGWKSSEFTKEHKRNMSIAASKRKRSIDHINKLHEGRRNSKNSKEHNEKIKLSNTGKKHTPETIEKLRSIKKNDKKTKSLAAHAGKISAEKYKNSPERQKQHSDRMKMWWAEKKKKEGLVDGD